MNYHYHHNDLLEGFRVGAEIGNSLSQAMLQRELMKRQQHKDAIEEALLQIKYPGLQIAKQGVAPDRNETMQALPMDPENDNIQMLGDGIAFNRGDKSTLQVGMDQPETHATVAQTDVMIPIMSPDGRIKKIPKNQVEAALKAGGKFMQ